MVVAWLPVRAPTSPAYFGVDREVAPLRLKPRARVERLSWEVGCYAFRTRAEARKANREIAFDVGPVRRKVSWLANGVVFRTRSEARRYCRRVNGNP